MANRGTEAHGPGCGSRGTQNLFDNGLKGLPEPLCRETLGVLSQLPRIEIGSVRAPDGFGKTFGALAAEQNACFSVCNGFEAAALGEGNDRPSTRLRFERGDAEVLPSGYDERAALPVQVSQLVVRDEFDIKWNAIEWPT